MWGRYDELVVGLAVFFGVGVIAMHRAIAVALCAFGLAAFIGMALGGGTSTVATVATGACLLTGSCLFDRTV